MEKGGRKKKRDQENNRLKQRVQRYLDSHMGSVRMSAEMGIGAELWEKRQ